MSSTAASGLGQDAREKEILNRNWRSFSGYQVCVFVCVCVCVFVHVYVWACWVVYPVICLEVFIHNEAIGHRSWICVM